MSDRPHSMSSLVLAAASGDMAAYARLVQATQPMVYAVARRVLREPADALDATQEAFLRAYRSLRALEEPAAFPGYLRRIAIASAQDQLRARRATFVPNVQLDALPVLDEREQRWTEAQRTALARALTRLGREERRVVERFYHGGWTLPRLAEEAGVSELAMRKRLQRIRDKLREEIETMEKTLTRDELLPDNLSARVIELLAQPILVDLPESPIGQIAAKLQQHFSEYRGTELAEVVDLTEARARYAHDPVYIPEHELFHIDATRILRYDLSLPLTLAAAGSGAPLRLLSTGKVYRNGPETSTHIAAFHQLELLELDERPDPWRLIGRVLDLLDALVPGAAQRVERTEYPYCSRAWDIGVEIDGQYVELLGCGVYKPEVVRLLGGDPARHGAIGLGMGLERLASLHFGIPDIRKLGAS